MDILENSVLFHDQKAPRSPLISGFSFTFDPKKEPSKRIQKVKINNLPIELEKVYKVATVDYLLLGGDGFGAFKKSKILPSEKEISLVDTLIEYFKKRMLFLRSREGLKCFKVKGKLFLKVCLPFSKRNKLKEAFCDFLKSFFL